MECISIFAKHDNSFDRRDESPITPSSSCKHPPGRRVSTDNDEQDFGALQRRSKDQNAAQFNATDGNEEQEEGEVAPEGNEPEKSEGSAPDILVNRVSTWAEDGPSLDQLGPVPPSELIQVLSMDSDTDVEGEEEEEGGSGPAGPVTPPHRTPPPPVPPPTAHAPTGRDVRLI